MPLLGQLEEIRRKIMSHEITKDERDELLKIGFIEITA